MGGRGRSGGKKGAPDARREKQRASPDEGQGKGVEEVDVPEGEKVQEKKKKPPGGLG